ncbi:oxidoreductase [Candidatus Kaiserbacteria bacterium CG10_big_fil_rev_8_21_14_0_10_51_14]|uniref:Oxidoreductase n=1 Tax=Candidatus Kaiserbacteria bacterium CG10_big_fil_rev_8_21_14_0_10_51_14 TaxID=1974610 RepID=A0A2H0UBR9_9BACT|nr:MAG: oxidoreductase [Candidatus Kaiserbacteria bacterium CG10_big_fil_rev_8_21_14_0_10_51_14]
MTRFGAFVLLVLLIIVGGVGYLTWNNWSILTGIAPLVRPAPELQAGEPLPFTLSPGFTARIYASSTPGARVLALDPRGVIVASLTSEGKVVALPDENGDGVADTTVEVITGLNKPHGIVFRCDENNPEVCRLFIAEEDVVQSYTYDPTSRKASLPKTLMSLPSDGGHSTRSLHIMPDNKKILVAVGSSCNVCNEENALRAAISMMDPETGEHSIYAKGLRNTVFMTINPIDGSLWGTDMGRDLLGDDTPPDEVNIIEEGKNYGWPICYGGNIHDTQFNPDGNATRSNGAGKNTPCASFQASHIDIPAHAAPLGLVFIPEEGWPEDYWHDLLVAYHGSWNRSVPTGYKIVRIELDTRGNPTGEVEDFMTGFTRDGEVIGRPVGLLVQPGGTLYVSDDRASVIYKITRN